MAAHRRNGRERSLCVVAIVFIGCMTLASGNRLLRQTTATAYSSGGNTYSFASSSPGGTASASASSGSSQSTSTSTNGQGTSFATNGQSSAYSSPSGTFTSGPKDSSVSAGSVSGVSGSTFATAFSEMPDCEDSSTYRYCCNLLHKNTDVCKCTLSPLTASYVQSSWNCNAERVPVINLRQESSSVWQDVDTGKMCYCD